MREIVRDDTLYIKKGVNMDKQKLIEYLEIVVDLEKQKYLQEKTIYELDCQISSLGIRNRYNKPDGRLDETWEYSLPGAGVGAMAGAVVSMATCKSFGDWKLIEYALIGAASFFVIGFIYGYAKDKWIHREQLSIYNAAVQADDERLREELVQRDILKAERDSLYEQWSKTKKTLQQFYDVGILYGKYHNDFVAVASFLDYFMSGRCSTLGENRGGDGAYNTYEAELLQHRILNKLDQIIESLEQIKSNQWTIYSAIQEGNRISAGLVDATNRLAAASENTAANSAIAAYNSQQSANELNQIKWLQLYGMTLR